MKLRTKFSLLTCTLSIIVVFGVAISFYFAEKKLIEKETRNNQLNVVQGLAQVGKEALIAKNEIITINYLNQLKNIPGIDFASLTNTNNDILSHTNIDLLGKKLNQIPDENIELTIYSLPILINNTPQATAWIGFSKALITQKINENLKNIRNKILSVVVIGIFIGLVGAIILSSMMTKNIKYMAVAAESIGNGNLSTKIHVNSNDELGHLAQDLNKMAKKLSELDQMKQDFVSSITHEFRSPLNAMSIHFDLLLKERLGELSSQQKDSINVLKSNANRLSKFIDDLLDLAKLERGKMTIIQEIVTPNEIMEEIYKLYAPQASHKGLILELNLPETLPKIYDDPDRTKQVLANLVNNAIKFTQSGSIAINAKYIGVDFLEISVSDTGQGIPEDQLITIFDKFEQVKGIREKVTGQKGTGLGLSIVKGIVASQGGTISLESKLGQGSTFKFTVPINK